MSEIERRLIADAVATNRLLAEQGATMRLLDTQKMASQMLAQQESYNLAANHLSEVARAAARSSEGFGASGALAEAARRAVEQWSTSGLGLTALQNATQMESLLSVRGSSAKIMSELARAAQQASDSVLAQTARDLRDLRITPPPGIGLLDISLLELGLGHGWAGPSLAKALAPARAVAVLTAELADDLERDEPTAVRTLELAATVSEQATAAGVDLADATSVEDADEASDRLADAQAALPHAVEHPLILFHAVGREIVASGDLAAAGRSRTFMQANAFRDVGRLLTACRRESVAHGGGDIFGVSPDAIDAQMMFMTACVVDQETATTVLAGMYVLLCESANAVALKDYRRHGLTLPGWVDVEAVVQVLRNNMGTLHERDGTGRYTSARKALQQLGVTGFPTLAEEWMYFGDRLAVAAVSYIRGLRDFLASH